MLVKKIKNRKWRSELQRHHTGENMRGWKLRGCVVRLCDCNAANARWRLHLVYLNAVHSAGVFLGDKAVPAPSFTCLSLKLGADVMTHLLINYSCLIICNKTKPKEKKKQQSWRLLCFDKSNWLCITAAYQAFNHSYNLKWDMKNLNSLHESSFYLSSLARLNRNHSVCIDTRVPCVEYNACPPCWDRKF